MRDTVGSCSVVRRRLGASLWQHAHMITEERLTPNVPVNAGVRPERPTIGVSSGRRSRIIFCSLRADVGCDTHMVRVVRFG